MVTDVSGQTVGRMMRGAMITQIYEGTNQAMCRALGLSESYHNPI